MKIIREQNSNRQSSNGYDSPNNVKNTSHGNNHHLKPTTNLCGDCDELKYCQFARNLSHSHDAQLTSRKIINGDLNTLQAPLPPIPDQHILAERLKLRYQTCPFHRELSLGLESSAQFLVLHEQLDCISG